MPESLTRGSPWLSEGSQRKSGTVWMGVRFINSLKKYLLNTYHGVQLYSKHEGLVVNNTNRCPSHLEVMFQ